MIKRIEKLIIASFFVVLLTLAGIYAYRSVFYTGFLAGYLMGVLSFLSLAFSFGRLDSMPEWFKAATIVGSSLKILFILLLTFLLKLLGLSVVQIAAGLLASQFIIITTIIFNCLSQQKFCRK
jgi:hypothetical protein